MSLKDETDKLRAAKAQEAEKAKDARGASEGASAPTADIGRGDLGNIQGQQALAASFGGDRVPYPTTETWHAWTKEEDAQLLIYLRDSEDFEAVATKMKMPVHQVRIRLHQLVDNKKEFAMIKKELRV